MPSKRQNLKATDIDLLIYCGVGKGFLEPANAYSMPAARDDCLLLRHRRRLHELDPCAGNLV